MINVLGGHKVTYRKNIIVISLQKKDSTYLQDMKCCLIVKKLKCLFYLRKLPVLNGGACIVYTLLKEKIMPTAYNTYNKPWYLLNTTIAMLIMICPFSYTLIKVCYCVLLYLCLCDVGKVNFDMDRRHSKQFFLLILLRTEIVCWMDE